MHIIMFLFQLVIAILKCTSISKNFNLVNGHDNDITTVCIYSKYIVTSVNSVLM